MGFRRHILDLVRRLLRRSAQSGAAARAAASTSVVLTPYVNWLDDARKLRPPRSAQPTTVTLSRAALLRPMRFVADATRAVSRDSGATLGETTPASWPAQPVFKPALPEPEVTPPPDVDFLDASPDAMAALTDEQRMLVRIKYLVRKGIFNEGFAADVPQQYRHSLGMDDNDASSAN